MQQKIVAHKKTHSERQYKEIVATHNRCEDGNELRSAYNFKKR